LIYIACPRDVATGGTELLHQLYQELRNHTENVRMFYIGDGEGNPVPSRFQKYHPEWAVDVADTAEHTLIFPEIFTNFRAEYKKIRLFCWWLSVDNYYLHRNKRRYRVLRKFGKFLSLVIPDAIFKDTRVVHLSQCERISQFLREKGCRNILSLSDYLNDEYLLASSLRTPIVRRDVVLFNPKKGKKFTKKIMASAPDLTFIPIQGLTPSQVADLLWSSKIYIDFGNHPGKDRFPREAAAMGCLVITGKKGSAGNDVDVPILGKYKFDDREVSIAEIIKCIRLGIDNYDACVHDFDDYRLMISGEKRKFETNVMELFKGLIS